MKFCTRCGKELMDEAVICPGCGCAVQEQGIANKNSEVKEEASKSAIVLGIVGIVGGILLAIVGHICSVLAIIFGIIDCTEKRKPTGLILGIIGEVISIFSSIIGAAMAVSIL